MSLTAGTQRHAASSSAAWVCLAASVLLAATALQALGEMLQCRFALLALWWIPQSAGRNEQAE